ncbi:MAG TPA: LLM class F420-dependent oxidoreductase [Candidatus Binataceae bacterium]|nr:LLM class F420-dependent oxidoreductase [Candidatus Binataceae bacterium]
MKFGIGFATSGAFSQPDLLAHLATNAERCGFESLWSVEHVAIPVKHLPYPGSKDGSMPGGDDVAIPDPLIPLAYVAAITKTIKLATGVLILPQRHPIYTAKEVATVDLLSGGRAILGIGSGWMKEEFDSLGIDFHKRGAMTDEAIQALRILWREGAAAFEGKHFKFGPLHSNPKPVNRNVPIHVGGHSSAAAKRAGRYGDGFFPTVMNPEKLKELFALVRAEAQRAGRNPDTIEFSCMARSLKPDDLKALADIGVARVVTTPPGTKPEVVTRWLEKLQEETISRS